jgi:hypothetical protein
LHVPDSLAHLPARFRNAITRQHPAQPPPPPPQQQQVFGLFELTEINFGLSTFKM